MDVHVEIEHWLKLIHNHGILATVIIKKNEISISVDFLSICHIFHPSNQFNVRV